MHKIKATKVGVFVTTHKKTSIAILIALALIIYYTIRSLTSTAGDPTYVLGTVEKATIVSSISASGQVSANRELQIKPKVSGDVTYVAHSAGDVVHAGDLLVSIDASSAQKAVRDAQANLQSAQISLQKLQQPADTLTLLQSQNALTSAQDSLSKAYDDGFGTVSSAFLTLPTVVTGLDTVLHGTDANAATSQQRNIEFYADAAGQAEGSSGNKKSVQLKTDAENAYQAAKAAYDANFTDYKNTSRSADPAQITALIAETYTTAAKVSDAVKTANNLIQYYQDVTTTAGRTVAPKSNAHIATLNGYTNTANTNVSSLANAKETISSDTYAVAEKTAALKKTQDGTDALDLQSAQLSVTQRKNALADAQQTLADYYVRAPFDGTLATFTVHRADTVSSGTVVGTLITADQVATVTLNEVDAAKVQLGQRATLTFDAIDDLTLTGKVASIDTVGTVSQGVVNYTVTIGFDLSDPRVKPGMSVNASIITATAQDVLTVPSSAIKTVNGETYIQTLPNASATDAGATTTGIISTETPVLVPVTLGLSDDTSTEIKTGATEGQSIIVKTTTSNTATKTTASAASLLSGNRAGGSGTTRATGRIGG